MTFKKDYVNYVLHTVLAQSPELKRNRRLSALVDRIIAVDDTVKITYLVGKTAGLEVLFKYLLYVSDKIDKSQITVFNLRDNFDYDVQNISSVLVKLVDYKDVIVERKIAVIDDVNTGSADENKKPQKKNIRIAGSTEDDILTTEEAAQLQESEDEDSPAGLTLIENSSSGDREREVFDLEEISDDIETTVKDETEETERASEGIQEEPEYGDEETVNAQKDSDEIMDEVSGDVSDESDEVFGIDELEDEMDSGPVKPAGNEKAKKDDVPLEIEVRKPVRDYNNNEEVVKEESVTNEAYYTFETKFFEEVKILEKLFSGVEKDCRSSNGDKPGEKCLQSLTEIIEITSELSNLARQLFFDLIADIFLTMNLYFTKAINAPSAISGERIRLLNSALALVNSLIKNEDYLNYDVIVDKVEALRNELQRPAEKTAEIKIKETEVKPREEVSIEQEHRELTADANRQEDLYGETGSSREPRLKQSELDSVNFKMRYLVKEFEKSFLGIANIKGEYKRFDALEKVDELNNALRLIAKISAAVKMRDILKLAEVSYVFLKYLKDYRMDLMEPEIQQIIKYIIFTFKMLLTARKPEDFNVLVQYLNNPVKIFADS